MTQSFKYQGNNEYGLDVYYDRHNGCHYVNIPHTYVGYGSGTLERANNQALKADAEMWTELCLNDVYGVYGTAIAAIVDHYTDEHWDQLADLIQGLQDYAVYDDAIHSDVERDSQIEAIDRMLPYDAEVEPEAVLYAIHELALYFVEEEGENWYITEQDLNAAIQYAIRNKL